MKREVGGNLLKLLFFLGCAYGIVRISIWSFFQTQMFFTPFDTDGTKTISTALALAFQYGQNVALFLSAISASKILAYKNKLSKTTNPIHINILNDEIRKSQKTVFIYNTVFGVAALVDAGTNVGQFLVSSVPSASLLFSGVPLTLFIALGSLLNVSVVFIEEVLMDGVNAILHSLNDILESLGKPRIPSLDLFVDPDKVIATRLDERSGGKNKSENISNNYQNVPNSIPKKVVTQMPMGFGQPQTSRPAPKPQFNGGGSRNPTYHPASFRRDVNGEELE